MESAGKPGPFEQANPATAKSGIPSPLKSPFAIEKKPVKPTSLPATERSGGAAKLACELVCDDGREASRPHVSARPTTPLKRTVRVQRKNIAPFPVKLLSES